MLRLKPYFSFRYLVSRTTTQPCGFMDLVHEQCPLFQLAHITASRGKINSTLDSGKLSSSLLSNSGPLVTQTSTTLSQGCPWNTSNKIRGMHLLEAHKANPLSSHNNYGKTATNLNHLLVFQGLVVRLKVANERHSRS